MLVKKDAQTWFLIDWQQNSQSIRCHVRKSALTNMRFLNNPGLPSEFHLEKRETTYMAKDGLITSPTIGIHYMPVFIGTASL